MKPTIKVNKNYVFVATIINVLPLVINFFWILILREYRSEFPKKVINVSLTNGAIFAIFFFNITLYVLLVEIFFLLQNKRFVISKNISIYFKRKRFEMFFLFILIGKLFFLLKTGIGKAGSDWSANKFSFIFNICNIDTLFFVYYLSFRAEINKRFVFIIILFSTLQIVSGWTGFILTIVLMEIYCNIHSKKVVKYLLLLPCVFFIGALAYQFIYPLKMYIRLGITENITYSEALIKLMERMSWFSHACVGVQNSDKIVDLYRNYGYNHTEIKAFFRPIIPSFIFPNKDFRSINNILMNSVYPELKGSTSSNFGQLIYLYNLIRISFSDFTLYFIFLFINTFMYKLFMDMVSPNKNQKKSYSSNYILFAYILSIFSVGAIEKISYGWVSIIWTYAFLFLVRIIRVVKK